MKIIMWKRFLPFLFAIKLGFFFIPFFFFFCLFVSVAPSRLTITSDQSIDKITEPKKIGPFNEDSSLSLTCEVDKGKPIPTLQWFKNNQETGGKQFVFISFLILFKNIVGVRK